MGKELSQKAPSAHWLDFSGRNRSLLLQAILSFMIININDHEMNDADVSNAIIVIKHGVN